VVQEQAAATCTIAGVIVATVVVAQINLIVDDQGHDVTSSSSG
jgi:hypothetical protein